MQVYKCYVMPALRWFDANNEETIQPIEKSQTWYPEEQQKDLYLKFKYLETKYDRIYFKTKYGPIEIVQCRDCKYYPKIDKNGDVEWPDNSYKCPGRIDDPYYDWMPQEDFFCANGERGEVNE